MSHMFNLLPKTEKEAIRRQYRLRLAVIILWLSFGTFLIASVLLIPSYLLSSQKEKSARARFEALSKAVEQESAAELDKVLLDAKTRLALLSDKPPKVYLHELLVQVVSQKGNNISLSGFSFADSTEGKRGIDISGVAKDRTALLSFVKSLERTGLFEKVEVPISNFAKNTDIGFTVRTVGMY